MFLFRFIQYLSFRKKGRTVAWQEAYDLLCGTTDYLYLRKKELKTFHLTAVSLAFYCAALWWVAIHPLFSCIQMLIAAIMFSLVFMLYILNIYTYIPMEIKETKVSSRLAATRKPSSVAWKKPKLSGASLHHYFIYTTENGEKAVDMADRILGVDQECEEGERVFCFTGPNSEFSYLLPQVERASL